MAELLVSSREGEIDVVYSIKKEMKKNNMEILKNDLVLLEVESIVVLVV